MSPSQAARALYVYVHMYTRDGRNGKNFCGLGAEPSLSIEQHTHAIL